MWHHLTNKCACLSHVTTFDQWIVMNRKRFKDSDDRSQLQADGECQSVSQFTNRFQRKKYLDNAWLSIHGTTLNTMFLYGYKVQLWIQGTTMDSRYNNGYNTWYNYGYMVQLWIQGTIGVLYFIVATLQYAKICSFYRLLVTFGIKISAFKTRWWSTAWTRGTFFRRTTFLKRRTWPTWQTPSSR